MKLQLYDTTLRDGAQGKGISFSLADKLKVIKALDKLGISFIEAGYPGSNPKDQNLFKKLANLKLKNSKITAFGATARFGKPVSQDLGLKNLISANTKHVTIFGKSSVFQVKKILRISLSSNLEIIKKTIKYLASKNKKVFYDAEHFFDGYLEDSKYALQTLKVAQKAGAEAIILCDTNGGTMPWQIKKIVKQVKQKIKSPLGIHCHNDAGLAVASSLMAVLAGVSQVQGTVNGLGERTGNADILTLIANLVLKIKKPVVTKRQLKLLTPTSNLIYDILNLPKSKRRPYVGACAFTHKGGMHIDGVKKTGGAGFEHINPKVVGNERNLLISELAGRSAILVKIKKFFPKLKIDKNSAEVLQIYKALKLKESNGYQYEAAEASFLLLIAKILGKFKPSFQIKYYNVEVEGWGCLVSAASCLVPYTKDQKKLKSAAQVVLVDKSNKEYFAKTIGNGPINALAAAVYQSLLKIYPKIRKIKMVDYKIKVLDGNSGSAARARVWIEFFKASKRWATVAVSTNTTEASLQALIDGLEYGLCFG